MARLFAWKCDGDRYSQIISRMITLHSRFVSLGATPVAVDMICPYLPSVWFEATLSDANFRFCHDIARTWPRAPGVATAQFEVCYERMPPHFRTLHEMSDRVRITRFFVFDDRMLKHVAHEPLERAWLALFCSFFDDSRHLYHKDNYTMGILHVNPFPHWVADYQVFGDELALGWNGKQRLCKLACPEWTIGTAWRDVKGEILRGVDSDQFIPMSGRTCDEVLAHLARRASIVP